MESFGAFDAIAAVEETTAMNRTRSRPLLAFTPASIVAVVCGLADSSVWVAAGWGEPGSGAYFSLYYAIAVPCKALSLLLFMRIVRPRNAMFLWPIYLPIGITIFASVIMGNTSVEGVVQPVGTLISLAMTIMILSGENIAAYMKAFGLSCLTACLVFLFQLHFVPLNTHGLWEQSGRYSFIYFTQPNLGGEILFTGFIAFCIARVNMIFLIATFILFFVVINLVESRAAMLSILLAFSCYVYVERVRWLAPGSRIALISLLAVLIVVLGVLNRESVSHLFLLDDRYRGVGTGYVGREEHWESALNVFLQSPFFGVGFGYFRHDVVTPHSMWLGMLSMMGAMGFFMLVAMWRNGSRIYAANTTMFLLLLSFIPMTIFNDRFLNLNPYPFLLFVILFLPGKVLAATPQAREFRAVRLRNPLGNARLGAVR